MVDQETVKQNGSTAGRRFGASVTGFAHDLATLVELQFRLLAVDISDARKSIGPALALAAGAVLIAFSTLPVLLMAAAFGLAEWSGWGNGLSFLVVAVVALCLAAVCLGLVYRKVQNAKGALQRSKSELKETVRWVKESLRPDHHADLN
jgi:hypothetical protein